MTYDQLLNKLPKLLQAEYSKLTPSTDLNRKINEQILADLMHWFNLADRKVNASATICCEKYINAELDFSTPGNRGIGRMSDLEPRFAGKYRAEFYSNADLAQKLKVRFVEAVFLGYFFTEYFMEVGLNENLPRVPSISDSPEMLFDQWVSLIYSSAGAPAFDIKMERIKGVDAYRKVKSIWYYAVLDPIKEALLKDKIVVDEQDELLFYRYFDAGIALRLLESHPLSKEELMSVVTGGASAIEKQIASGGQNRGCSVLIFFLLLAAFISNYVV